MRPDDPDDVNRRYVLQLGTVILGLLLAGCAGSDDDDGADDAMGASDGIDADDEPPEHPDGLQDVDHVDYAGFDFAARADAWAWFPSDETHWSRSEDPYDYRVDDGRWLATPTEGGSIRCRVERDAAPGNAGFYVGIGPIRGVETITIDSETVESDSGDQQLLFAIFLDVTDDGDYFEWEAAGGREAFADFGGDVEGIGLVPADGMFTIDDDTEMDLVPAMEQTSVTLGELKAGVVEGVDDSTNAVIQVSVVGSGRDAVEEAVIHDVSREAVSIPEPPAASWPMYGNDEGNTGSNGVIAGPSGPIEARWTVETGGPVQSSPAVVDGSVYVGSDDGALYAFDTVTGDQVWSFDTGGPVRSSPAVLGDRVYVGSDDGHLYAVSRETGEVGWKYDTGAAARSPVTVEHQTGAPWRGHLAAIGNDAGVVFAFDERTGELRQSFDGDGEIVEAPFVYYFEDGRWMFGAHSTGGTSLIWLPAASADSQFRRYEHETPRRVAPVTRTTADQIHYWGDDDGGITKFAQPGTPGHWEVDVGEAIRAGPTLAGDLTVVGTLAGNVIALDDETGDREWSFETDGPVESSPAAADGILYFGSGDGSVYAFDVPDGSLRWQFETPSAVRSSPRVSEGAVYAGNDDGTVYALTDE